MKAKLTLSIEEEKIKKIKRYAQKNGHTVSKFLEDMIDTIEKKQDSKKLDITKLRGILGKAPKNLNWKKMKTDYLVKKYVK